MPDYKYKNQSALAYDANKKRLRAEANIITSEALNEAIENMTQEFNSSLHNGIILELTDTVSVRKRLRAAINSVI